MPSTRPRQIEKTATIVSIDISIGSEASVAPEDAIVDKEAELMEFNAECSFAE